MNDDASGAPMGARLPGAAQTSPYGLRRVVPATAAERLLREEGMARALRNGAGLYRAAMGSRAFSSSRKPTTRRSSPGSETRATSAGIAACRRCERQRAAHRPAGQHD